jgi:hypothetical protein
VLGRPMRPTRPVAFRLRGAESLALCSCESPKHGHRCVSPHIRRPLGTSARIWGQPRGWSKRLPKRETARLQAFFVDGARRIRTADLLGAIQALCQLSYSPEMADLQGISAKGRDGAEGEFSWEWVEGGVGLVVGG